MPSQAEEWWETEVFLNILQQIQVQSSCFLRAANCTMWSPSFRGDRGTCTRVHSCKGHTLNTDQHLHPTPHMLCQSLNYSLKYSG